MDNLNIEKSIRRLSKPAKTPSGQDYRLLLQADTNKLASELGLAGRIIEANALKCEVVPERYQRNMGTVGIEGQIRLLEASAAVIGAGGLGGFVAELLARMGVGRLVIIDGDTFSESNLNRQLYSTEDNLGRYKADEAAKRLASVNSAVEVTAHNCIGTEKNLPELLAGCNIVIDCLDNLPSRFEVAKVCSELGIVMVHGAIAGFLGQMALIYPDGKQLQAIYGEASKSGASRGVEVQLGNPAFTPAMLASWQVNEAVKLLAGLEGSFPPNKMLIIDMQSAESYRVDMS